MKTITDSQRIEEIFARGTVVEAFPSLKDVKQRLASGERLRIYYGLDPTHTAVHLGHVKNMIFLEELRQLGHEVIVLFGDFTARIGDPSDKAATRKQLTEEEVKRNMASWITQISPIIDFKDVAGDGKNPALLKHNSEWLSKLTFADVLELSSNFTVQQMLERDMFAKRMKENAPIHVHEFMYPLMQGYDSVAMEVDGELCGTDQIFNALAGRTLIKRLKDKDKIVIALNLVANPATGQLMSKSNGTGVFVDQTPAALFGSIMALPDPMIDPLFVNCTRIPLSEKDSLMAKGPRDAKAAIASDIVKRFHGEEAARAAEETWVKTFAKGGVPEEIEEVRVGAGELLSDALVKAGVVPSKTEWRRLVLDGAVKIVGGDTEEEKVTDPMFKPAASGLVLKVGKRRFVRVAQ